MLMHRCVVTIACSIVFFSVAAWAKVAFHPSLTIVESITPHTAINRTRYGTDAYTSFGGGVDIVFNSKVKLTPGYQFGIDVLGGQTSTYSNPSLTLSLAVTDKIEERLTFSGLYSNVGGYNAETFGIATYIAPTRTIELEITPQLFFDSIATKQIELDVDFDVNLGKRWQLNSDVAVGRTFVPHIMDLTSYSGGGGTTYKITDKLKIFAAIEFAHGLNTDSPYSILNSTSTINNQTGTRPIDFGNTALDPNGNTININIGTSLSF